MSARRILLITAVLGLWGTNAAQTRYLSTSHWGCALMRTGDDPCLMDTLVSTVDGCFWDLAITPGGALYGWWYSTEDSMGLYQIDTVDGSRDLVCPWTFTEEPPNNLVEIDDSTFFAVVYATLYKVHRNTCTIEPIPGGVMMNAPAGDLVLLGHDLYTITGFNELYRLVLNQTMDSVLNVVVSGALTFPTGMFAQGLCTSWTNGVMDTDRFLGFAGTDVYTIFPATLEAQFVCTTLPLFGEHYGATVRNGRSHTEVAVPTLPEEAAWTVTYAQCGIQVRTERGPIHAKVFALDGRMVAEGMSHGPALDLVLEGKATGIHVVRVRNERPGDFVTKLLLE